MYIETLFKLIPGNIVNSTYVIDILTSKRVEEYYKLYSRTEWYSQAEMENFQLRKLQKLITHCYNNVPYYRTFMKSEGLKPEDITCLNQLSIFPVISKEIIKENYDQFIPDNIRKIKGVKVTQTGGTTGNILIKRTDAGTRSSTWALYKRFERWMGVNTKERSLILMGGHVIGNNRKDSFKKMINNHLKNYMTYNPYDTSETNIQNIIKALKENRFILIRSYSQYLLALAQRLRNEGLFFDIKAITTTAEPLTSVHRKLFKEVFNAEIFDQYGCGEIGGIAFECGRHEGLHISEEKVIVEVNENNEVILTDLDNYAMPYLRYWNADQVILSDNKCSCGRSSKLIMKVMGRTCDYIIGLNGEFLHWAYFWHLLFDSRVAEKRNLKKFQIIQKKKDELLIRLISDPLTEEEKNLWINNIQSRAGKMNVSFLYEKNIENAASGKYRPVINELLN